MKNLYKLLNVDENATFKEIEDAFHEKMELNANNAEAIKEIEFAHYVLSDFDRRNKYDDKLLEDKMNYKRSEELNADKANIKKGYALSTAIISGILTALSLIVAIVFLSYGGGAAFLGGTMLFGALLYGVILVLAVYSLKRKEKVFAKANFIYTLVIFIFSTLGTIGNIVELASSTEEVTATSYVSVAISYLILISLLVLTILDFRQYRK